EKTTKITIGIMARSQLINPVSNKPNLNVSIPEKSACCILGDMNANKTSDMKNAGKVVHPIFLICANKSTCNIEEAIFVVSDKGDILSPKKAPDTMAPAVIGRDTSIAMTAGAIVSGAFFGDKMTPLS